MDVRRRCTALVLVSLLLVSLVLGGCTSATSTSATRGTDVGFASPLAATRVTHLSHRKQTERLVTRLLAAVRVPHDALPHSHAPTKQLAHADPVGEASNVVDHHRFWTVPGGQHRVLSYVERHHPSGCRFDGSGSSSGPGEPTVYDVMCDRRSTSYAYAPEVQVEAVATAHGSAVRADAAAVWFPHRPARSYVRAPSAARVTVERDPKVPGYHRLPTVRRRVPAGAAAKLAAVVDRLEVYPPVVYHCPADFAGLQDTIRFTTPHGPATVVVDLSGCPRVSVTIHHHETGLIGTAAVDAVVRHVLHLPRSYRR